MVMKMKKKLLTISFLVSCLFLVGCSQGSAEKEQKVEPLKAENKIPADGVISEKEMKTIEDKNKEVRFTKKTDQLSYSWIYQGKQVQNAVKQKLNLSIKTKDLESIKKMANNASEAIEIKSESMELAGTPTVELALSRGWKAAKSMIVRKQKGKLKVVSNSPVTVKKEAGKTILSYPVFESGVTYYLIGGGQEGTAASESSGAAPAANDKKAQTAGQNQTGDSAGDAAVAEDGQGNPVDPATGEQVQADDGTANQANDTNGGQTAGGAANQAAGGGSENKEDPATNTATLSISCNTILNNHDKLDKSKASFVPSNGVILGASQVELKSGDSVYDVLVRLTKQAGIQMEASWTPMYDAYYIEGINQLYEFDCGNLSGWMYKVNGWFPNYGASKYKVKKGDVIEWVYTCDLGRDVGGSNSMSGE